MVDVAKWINIKDAELKNGEHYIVCYTVDKTSRCEAHELIYKDGEFYFDEWNWVSLSESDCAPTHILLLPPLPCVTK